MPVLNGARSSKPRLDIMATGTEPRTGTIGVKSEAGGKLHFHRPVHVSARVDNFQRYIDRRRVALVTLKPLLHHVIVMPTAMD